VSIRDRRARGGRAQLEAGFKLFLELSYFQLVLVLRGELSALQLLLGFGVRFSDVCAAFPDLTSLGVGS
jgi:hypothetical protein